MQKPQNIFDVPALLLGDRTARTLPFPVSGKQTKYLWEDTMKLGHFANALCVGLLSGFIAGPVCADQPAPSTDILGLPVGKPITTQVTLPFLTKDQLLSQDRQADVVDIMQIQALYEYYHDGSDGEGVASLFTDDGILEIPYNDGAGHLSPTGGTNGNGCAAFGKAQIAIFFNPAAGPSASLPFPGHSHHVMTSMVVKVYDDNKDFATLNANYIDDSVNSAGVITIFHPGEYINDYARVGGIWYMKHLRPVEDTMITTANCTLSGQSPK
jgi:hypothetical protein